jgi:hypothetical protein
MTESLIEQFIRSLAGPNKKNGGTDAPGTTSRVDAFAPDLAHPLAPDSGTGVPASLGYPNHGDAPAWRQAERAEAAVKDARRRFPELATYGRAGPAVPEFNVLYDQIRSDDAYDKIILNTAHGAWVVGTTTVQPVTLDNPANLRTSQYPGAIQAMPVLLLFTWSQSVAATSGQYSMFWQPQGGDFLFPLGEYNATTVQQYNSPRWVIPLVVTDPGVTQLGNIIITSTAVVGTPTILWRMGIGWAYPLPTMAFKGHVPHGAGEWQEVHQRGELVRQP